MSLIELRNIEKSFGDFKVIRGVDLDVDKGEVISIIGQSGSGKTTLLRCINGLETINAGSIKVSGVELSREPKQLRALRLEVGMIFQQFNLFPHLTAGENVALAQIVVLGRPKMEAHEIAKRNLARVGLLEKLDKYPHQLSGGQQQRVAIARALAMSPKALLCDEITSALDPELVGEVLAVVRSLASEGMTLMMVTHEMEFARRICDRVVYMRNGIVHEIGTSSEIFETPQTPELKQFLSAMKH
ncbi:putative ATP-binding protein component of ABC transporter [Rhizobium freirei PRF 81]|uniref:Putative ATP-binding protein component of ABC transporter n=1 Tax=Rhizobium freirei PRF 81 TaxID=363754 RepID=N6UE24_9HYPH|nr:amino acid ABC transporter ATP-binding protein [Rhizobium freirei]ENN88408.1 putative ATP-binding protein component of ABC transporter [Rhizobium freirei PRF 81]